MKNNINQAALLLHRERVADAATFHAFQEAQLDLLDFMIEAVDDETAIKALSVYSKKFLDWRTK